MITVIELESEEGASVYLNPDHVVSVSSVPQANTWLSDVTLVGDACWRVKGACRDVAAHIFGEVMGANGKHYARFMRPGSAVRYDEARPITPTDDRVLTHHVLGRDPREVRA